MDMMKLLLDVDSFEKMQQFHLCDVEDCVYAVFGIVAEGRQGDLSPHGSCVR